MLFSFIIPAINEERYIANTIDAIRRNVEGRYPYEIIVVENGSSDRTVDIIKDKGVRVIYKKGVTIGRLRNAGVAEARGGIIVFLDADVYLGNNWHENIGDVIKLLEKNPETVTGSYGGVKKDAGWIERSWYGTEEGRKKVNFIPTRHMIIKKEFFEKIGGFDAGLVTGEDSEICRRAKRYGARIINNLELKVVHQDFPNTLQRFFQNNRWHGLGDYSSIHTFIASRPAIFSMAQLIILIACLATAIICGSLLPLLVYLLSFLVICAGSSFYKIRRIDIDFLRCIFLYAVYFYARTFSFFDAFIPGIKKSDFKLHQFRQR